MAVSNRGKKNNKKKIPCTPLSYFCPAMSAWLIVFLNFWFVIKPHTVCSTRWNHIPPVQGVAFACWAHTSWFCLPTLSCQRVLSLRARDSGVQVMKGVWGETPWLWLCTCKVQEDSRCTHRQKKICGREGGRFSKEVTDSPNVLIMSQWTVLGLYFPRLYLL